MFAKPSNIFNVKVFAILLNLLFIGVLASCSTAGVIDNSESGSAGMDESAGDAGLSGESAGDDTGSDDASADNGALDSCPQGPIFMDIEMIEAWTWSPGGIEELGRIEGWGKVTCMAEISGSTVTGEVGCYFQYTNEGYIQGDPGRCDIKGQGVAIASITGSCDNFTVTLQIDETVEPDEDTGDIPMTATMKCDKNTYPYLTYFPFTWFEVEVPLAAGEFEFSLGKGDCPHDFIACDKLYYFSVHDPGFQE
jgi:hypothetical protein